MYFYVFCIQIVWIVLVLKPEKHYIISLQENYDTFHYNNKSLKISVFISFLLFTLYKRKCRKNQGHKGWLWNLTIMQVK